MRSYTAQKYEDLVENIDDEVLQRFMSDEKDFIAGISGSKTKTFIDMGAGNGRVEPFLSVQAKSVIAIEINPEMIAGLKKRTVGLKNVEVIEGDFFGLTKILPKELKSPVFLFLQNTLGTIEGGTAEQAIDITIGSAINNGGEIVLSLFRQSALKSWGIEMYRKLAAMLGRPDPDKTVYDNGVFVTDTDYTSKWWTDKEIEKFKSLGNVVRDFQADEYVFLELAFSKD